MKKKICLVLVLIFVLCMSLAACGSNEDVGGQVAANDPAPATIPGGVIEQPEATVAETTPPEENLSLGRMEGGVYINEYVGYACNLDSNWSFLSAEELQQIPETVSDAISGSELAEALKETQQFTDMMAENVTDLTSMNVLYQKLSLQERLAYAVLTDEQIADATLEQRDMLVAAYEQAGITVYSIEKVTVTFMGEERFAVRTEASVQDVPYYLVQLFDFHQGAYAVTTTLASYVEDNTDSLMELFYKLEP